MTHEPPATRGLGTAATIRKSLFKLMLATAVLYVALLGIVAYVYLDGKTTNNALCSLRADLVTRVTSSIEFLKRNPEGIRGISDEDILESISGQQRTIIALSNLDCGNTLKIPQVPPQPTP